jgi:hypothetical protein
MYLALKILLDTRGRVGARSQRTLTAVVSCPRSPCGLGDHRQPPLERRRPQTKSVSKNGSVLRKTAASKEDRQQRGTGWSSVRRKTALLWPRSAKPMRFTRPGQRWNHRFRGMDPPGRSLQSPQTGPERPRSGPRPRLHSSSARSGSPTDPRNLSSDPLTAGQSARTSPIHHQPMKFQPPPRPTPSILTRSPLDRSTAYRFPLHQSDLFHAPRSSKPSR